MIEIDCEQLNEMAIHIVDDEPEKEPKMNEMASVRQLRDLATRDSEDNGAEPATKVQKIQDSAEPATKVPKLQDSEDNDAGATEMPEPEVRESVPEQATMPPEDEVCWWQGPTKYQPTGTGGDLEKLWMSAGSHAFSYWEKDGKMYMFHATHDGEEYLGSNKWQEVPRHLWQRADAFQEMTRLRIEGAAGSAGTGAAGSGSG